LLSIAIIGANYTNDFAIVIAFMSVALFRSSIASAITWALLSEIAPKELLGMSALYSMWQLLGGTTSPMVVGLSSTNPLVYCALVYAAVLALIGAYPISSCR